MKVGILGSGIVGETLANGFIRHGHQVTLGTRDPNSAAIKEQLTRLPGASAATFAEAARFGELLVLAVLGRMVDQVIALADPKNCAEKIIIDATNPIANKPPINGVLQFTTGPNESLGEYIQALLPSSHVVKAFNSVGNALMVNPGFEHGPPTMFICGNSAEAKEKVATVLKQFGWEALDCGGIVAARAIEPLCMLWCIPAILRNQTNHAFKLLM